MTKKKRVYLLLAIFITSAIIIIVYNTSPLLVAKIMGGEMYWGGLPLGKKIDYEFTDYRETINLEEMEIIARQIASAYLMNETIKGGLTNLTEPISPSEFREISGVRSSSLAFYMNTRRTAEGRNIFCYSKKYYKCIDAYLFYLGTTWGPNSSYVKRLVFFICINKRGQAYLLYGFPQNDTYKLLQDQLKEVKTKESAWEVFDLLNESRVLGSALLKESEYECDSASFSNYKDIVKEKTIEEKEDAFVVNATFEKELEYDSAKITSEYKNIDIIISKKGKVTDKIINEKIYTKKR